MSNIDKRNKLDEIPFEYKVLKDEKLEIRYFGKPVMMLKGPKALDAIKKLTHVDGKDEQLILAKLTGNFKRGNERNSKSSKD